ncbi:MAG: hypothetical protein LBI13_00470 [Streptococcaceae bacterium]|jgi:hypothetical protein|nr:hypothetical protein [Streptococcaceae bacterium]
MTILNNLKLNIEAGNFDTAYFLQAKLSFKEFTNFIRSQDYKTDKLYKKSSKKYFPRKQKNTLTAINLFSKLTIVWRMQDYSITFSNKLLKI